MGSKNLKLARSLETLSGAFRFMEGMPPREKEFAFLSIAKAFETAIEYAWRHLRDKVQSEGLDVPSPKAAIREAARLGLIDNAAQWIEFVTARNAGVHDYFGTTNEDYIKIAAEFLKEAKKII